MHARNEPRLVLLCALPASGKTTLARRPAAEIPAVPLCSDDWLADLGIDPFDRGARDRLEQRLRAHAQDLLRLGQTVVLEFGFLGRPERDAKRSAAHSLGVPVELHRLKAPVDESCRRPEARERAGAPGAVPAGRRQLEEYARFFQAPDAAGPRLFDPPPPERRG
ncbi:ATP-binding protein [Streptomyces sp. VRA16 Mangrove soil]|uniref:AAA family ATPase n=1 Tax=Streptomyces sp. VRA16 Mangrove soil TaxID=2817434 RepID=UPI001A9D58D1|nr:ATP-binding protein [Streptomyces sp. VRA16 Mangrove soil]MBO1329979.1 ATP-binding protein [Streptomyces sp. VRA16 Mangrove soil]